MITEDIIIYGKIHGYKLPSHQPASGMSISGKCSPDPASTYPRFKVFASSQTSLRDLMIHLPSEYENEGIELGALNLVMIDIRAFFTSPQLLNLGRHFATLMKPKVMLQI